MEKRYFKNWMYNRGILLNKLVDIVENNGGYLATKKGYESGFQKLLEIHNCSVTEEIMDCEIKIEKCTAEGERFDKHREKLRAKIEELSKRKPAPYRTQITSFVSFVLDGKYYYIELNDNPFLENLISKVSMRDMKLHYSHYMDTFSSSDWFYDCLYSYDVNDAEFTEIANIIFNQILKQKDSEICFEKKRVANTYDGRWHYEKIPVRREYTIVPAERIKLEFVEEEGE